MWMTQFQGFSEIFLEVFTINLVRLIVAADGLAPVPSQLLLIWCQPNVIEKVLNAFAVVSYTQLLRLEWIRKCYSVMF